MTNPQENIPRRTTSTELTGGAGFTYQDTIVAYYLAHLLRRERAAGLPGIVTHVAVEQHGHGNPMDDVVITLEENSLKRTLGLQAKQQLTISAAATNTDFRDIVGRALATRAKPDFQPDDGYGFVTEHVAVERFRAIERIVNWAKASTSADAFSQRFSNEGTAGNTEQTLRDQLGPLINAGTREDEWRFYAQFVALKMDGLGDAGVLRAEIVNRLQELVLENEDGLDVLLFDRLCQIARTGAGTARSWNRRSVLVPFVTCILVRGEEFEDRFNKRLGPMREAAIREDNAKAVRIIEIQRLLAPVLVAEWTVITLAEAGEPLIVNDWARLPAGPGAGISIPLGPDHVLQVVPRTQSVIARLDGETWKPSIHNVTTRASNRASFNEAMGRNARRFLFGRDCQLVSKYIFPDSSPMEDFPDPGFIHGTHALVHEFVWHRFVSALHKGITSDMKGWDFDFDFEGLAKGWVPPMMAPTNLPYFLPGLERIGDEVIATLYDPPNPMPIRYP